MNFGDLNDLDFKHGIDDDSDFIPLLSIEDEDNMRNEKVPEILPILPLRNTVLFPGVVIPITVGRDKSIHLIKDYNKGDKTIGVVAQKSDSTEEPNGDDLYSTGTVAHIIKMLRMPDGNTTIIIQGKKRFKIDKYIQTEPYHKATVTAMDEEIPLKTDKEFQAIISNLKETSTQIVKISPNIPSDASFAINNIESPTFLVNFISSNMNAKTSDKQKMLEVPNLKERSLLVLEYLNKELQMLELRNQIQNKTKVDLDKQQREYFLNQQIKTIQEELGGTNFEQEINEYREQAENKKWSKEIKEIFDKQLSKLQRMNPNAAEHGIQTNYVELLLELPWNEITKDNFDLQNAQEILDEDHFGLEKVKERIIEHLAVLKLKKNLKSPIICLYGPPGVGKTSLGKSIAKALNRKYVRMSLGGLKDESEIRGHRKTYIGAMPGRVLQNLKKVQSSNPVFILDEIDKVGSDYHGDPSSALLEVLDPEQNSTFYDNFLELDYDLSKVMFIATCNNLNTIQPALRDRMEIIEVNGYTVEEKMEIAKRHLIPKQIEESGLKKSQLKISDKVLEYLIDTYTAESGVRNLEKTISKIARNSAVHIAKDEEIPKITEEAVLKILGPSHIKDKYQGNDIAGVVTGLAWTQVGGDILFIETSLSKSKSGKLTLTGNLGDVMKESATLALEYLKAHPHLIDADMDVFETHNIHIHVPEGGTPKDGPSAGIAMLTSLASAFTRRKVKKALAMTGEITLRGKVLPVGGIKEKLLAAKRAGIKEVILCLDNKKDVEDIKPDYLKGLTFHYVTQMEDVLKIALLKEKVKELN
ncbi:endopeptidase La [Aurantibacillus circumpalustris]|uniref:endopeptidase La n=1 Tax=Aurantibacillus circumpalustris TaxID=3036359 RepID=UPI00295BEBA1|nr:endopeptidase La [Aurantibacillus circumpalustris]